MWSNVCLPRSRRSRELPCRACRRARPACSGRRRGRSRSTCSAPCRQRSMPPNSNFMRPGRTASGLIGAAIVAASIGAFLLWRANQRPATVEPAPPEIAGASDSLTLLARPRPVPIVNFVNGDGKPMTTADFGGRIILLNVWATWCAPCRKEMPTLRSEERRVGGPDFEVVALSIDRQGRAVVAPFYRELGIKALHIYLDQSAKAIGRASCR